MSASAGARGCRSCRAPLAPGQRFCLHCGTRDAAPILDWKEALGFTSAQWEPVAPPVLEPRRRGGRAVVVAAVLAGGLGVGAAFGPAPARPQVAVRGPLLIVADAPAPAAAAPAPVAATTTPEPEADTPAAVAVDPPAAEETPAGTEPDTTTTTTKSTPTPDPSDGDGPTAAPTPAPAPAAAGQSAIRHAWVIALRGHDAAETFSTPGAAPFLADAASKNIFLSSYAPLALDPDVSSAARLAGRDPADPPAPGCGDTPGCTFGPAVGSLPAQLAATDRKTRVYEQEPGLGCRPPLAAFAALVQDGSCAKDEVPFEQLAEDLKGPAADVPTLSLVVLDPCHDGRVDPCPAGGPKSGLAAADDAVGLALSAITASAAYRDGGVIAVPFDAPAATTPPGAAVPATGAVVLSAATTTPRTIAEPTGPFTLLRTLEDGFAVPALGHAAEATAFSLTDAVPPKTRRDP